MKVKKYQAAAAGIVIALGMALSGCAAGGAGTEAVYVTKEEEADMNTITVTGREVVKIEPDMAEMVFVVETEDEDSVKCQQKNAELVDSVITYLKGHNLSETSIKTSGYSLSDDYGWLDGDYQFIGYEMTTRITASDVTIDKAGSLLAGGVAAGATGVRSVSYYSSRYDEAYDEALTKAVDQARDKAQTLAAAGGNTLGGIVLMEEYSDSQYGRYVSSNISIDNVSMFGNGDGDDSMPVMAGEMEVSAEVKVVFEFMPVN